MKTRKVKLYADLFPGWHEATTDNLYVSAHSNPSVAYEGPKRVEIEVELPCIDREYPSDFQVKGEVKL